MTLGLKGGIALKQFNTENLIFPSGIDQFTGEISEYISTNYSDEKKFYPDFGAGAVGQYGEFFMGVSEDHINRPDESIIEGDRKGLIPVKMDPQCRSTHAPASIMDCFITPLYPIPNILYQHREALNS